MEVFLFAIPAHRKSNSLIHLKIFYHFSPGRRDSPESRRAMESLFILKAFFFYIRFTAGIFSSHTVCSCR